MRASRGHNNSRAMGHGLGDSRFLGVRIPRGELPSTFIGCLTEPFTRESANMLAQFLRSAAPRLSEHADVDAQAELEITLAGYVARLRHFTDGSLSSAARGTAKVAQRTADQLVKTLCASGLLRNRNKLRRALCLGLEGALPHWSKLCTSQTALGRARFAVLPQYPLAKPPHPTRIRLPNSSHLIQNTVCRPF